MPGDDLDPFPTIAIPLLVAIFTLSLAAKRNSGLHSVAFLVLFAAISYLNLYTSTSDPAQDYGNSTTLLSLMFFASDYLLLTDVHSELRLVGQATSIADEPFSERLKWVANLLFSSRGVGWTHEPIQHLPPRPRSSTRVEFALTQAIWTAVRFSINDGCCFFLRQQNTHALGASGWIWRCLNVSAFGITITCWIDMTYRLASIISVVLRLSETQDWPPIFGSLTGAYTLRRFWGRTWHQLMRRFLVSHGRFVGHRVLGLKQDSAAYSFVQLYLAFFISGIIHQAGDYSMHRSWGGTSVFFFTLQAVGITFEVGVVALAKRVGLGGRKTFGRVVGFVWVATWLTFCVPFWADPMLRAGMLSRYPKFSPARGLWSGDWII